MFNFWPFNVARKRREQREAERLVQQFRDQHEDIAAFWAQPKRNKVIPMGDPRHPRNLTPEQRQRIKEREAEQQAMLEREINHRMRADAERVRTSGFARHSRQRTETSAPPADDWNTNLLNPMNFASPLNPIYHSSAAPESRCDSPSDSSSYDCGSSSCSTD